MLNNISKDYNTYVGKWFDDWDELIDANGEVIENRDRVKHALEQDFFVEETLNGSVRLRKKNKPEPSNNNASVITEKKKEMDRLHRAIYDLPDYQKEVRRQWVLKLEGEKHTLYYEGELEYVVPPYKPLPLVVSNITPDYMSDEQAMRSKLDFLRLQYKEYSGGIQKIKYSPQPRKKFKINYK